MRRKIAAICGTAYVDVRFRIAFYVGIVKCIGLRGTLSGASPFKVLPAVRSVSSSRLFIINQFML